MEVNIFIDDKYGILDEDKYSRIIKRALQILKIDKDYDIELALVDNEEIRKINKKYRKIDKATDVLSFPFKYNKDLSKDDFVLPKEHFNKLGQIIISHDKASEQAEQNNYSLEKEVLLLFVHGLVHLLGFDHKNDAQESKMKNIEKQILN